MSVSFEHFSASSNSDTSSFKMVRTKMLNLRFHNLMGDFKVVISSFYLHSVVGFILTPLAADLMAWLSINIIKFALSFSYLRSIRYLRWIVTKAEEVYLLDSNIAHKCLWFRRLYSLQVFLWFKRKKKSPFWHNWLNTDKAKKAVQIQWWRLCFCQCLFIF